MSSIDFAQANTRSAWSRRLLEPIDQSAWEALTRELFAWQFSRVEPYRLLCQGHGITPENLKSWREIPPVPQQLFKLQNLFGYDFLPPEVIYETSGTTTGQPGRQHLLSSDIYRSVAVEGARRVGLFAGNPELHFLAPSPSEAPHSSLSAMFEFWRKALKQSGLRFWMRRGRFEIDLLRQTLTEQIRFGRPMAVDAWRDLPPLRFPPGSWLLETGGFKGRSREVPKAELYAEMSRLFTVTDNDIWNEYGMSELSSQAYAHGTLGLHETPPWAKVTICDPATNREVRPGRQGLVHWVDLANTDSVLALATLDLAERTATGFRLLGRLPRTEPRGCSLGVEDLISTQSSGIPAR
jgi:hypothetical protein